MTAYIPRLFIVAFTLSMATLAVIFVLLASVRAEEAAMTPARLKPNKMWYTHGVLPPVQYDHPYAGQLQVFRPETERMKFVCPKTIYPVTLACTQLFAKQGWCHITLAPDEVIESAGWTPEIVLRHEIGHCNGWSANHEGVRPLSSEDIQKLMRGEKISAQMEIDQWLKN